MEKVHLLVHPFYDMIKGGERDPKVPLTQPNRRRLERNWARMRAYWGKYVRGLKSSPNEVLAIVEPYYYDNVSSQRYARLFAFAKSELGEHRVFRCRSVFDRTSFNDWMENKGWLIDPEHTHVLAFGEYEDLCVYSELGAFREGYNIPKEHAQIISKLSLEHSPKGLRGAYLDLYASAHERRVQREQQKKRKKQR